MLLAMSAKRLIRAGEGVCSAKRSNSAAFPRYSETFLMALAWEGRLCPQGIVAALPRGSKSACGNLTTAAASLLAGIIELHSALRSSGTSPNLRITVASPKSPVAGSPVRLKATAPTWPGLR